MTTTQPADSNLAPILADGRPFIRCGCGFIAVSDDQEVNLDAMNAHPCPNAPADAGMRDEPWYSYVFSMWGFLLVVVLASAVLAAMGVRW